MSQKPYATIRPINLGHSETTLMLTGSLINDGITEYILDGTRNIVKSLDKPGSRERLKEMVILFNYFNPVYKIQEHWADRDVIVGFWKRHPLVNITGEPQKPSAKFLLEVVSETELKKANDTDSYIEALSVASAMSDSERRDVMIYFGRNPEPLTEREVKLYLCAPKEGALLEDKLRKEFLEVFSGSDKAAIKRGEMLILIRKAINAGILTKKGGNIYFDGDIVGSTDDAAVGYLTDHQSTLTNIKKAMGMKVDEVEEKAAAKAGKPGKVSALSAMEDADK